MVSPPASDSEDILAEDDEEKDQLVEENLSHRIYLRQFGHGYIMNYLQIVLNHFSRLCR